MPVRALLRVAVVENATPPTNHINMKVFYPALPATEPVHIQTAILPFDPQWSGAPIVIFLPGVNCSAYTYEWLAKALAEQGVVTVLTEWLAENIPGRLSISPGIDLEAVKVENYGQQPTSSSLTTLYDAVLALRDNSTIGEHVNFENIIFGGHSAGGTMALQNANRAWFPRLKASFAYCSNPLATGTLGGWDAGVIPPVPHDVPTLIMGAECDGIGDHHNASFGNANESGADVIQRLFETTPYRNSMLCVFGGANHHTICYPVDTSIGRVFLDTVLETDDTPIRHEIARLVAQFINGILVDDLSHIQIPTSANRWKNV